MKFKNKTADQIVCEYLGKVYFMKILYVLFIMLIFAVFCLFIEDRLNFKTYILIDLIILVMVYTIRYVHLLCFSNLYKVLYMDCDPYKLVEIFKKLKEKERSKNGAIILSLGLAQGLFYIGSLEESYQILLNLEFRKRRPVHMLHYYNLLANQFFIQNHMEKIREIREEVEKIRDTLRQNNRLQKPTRFLLNILNGQLAHGEQDEFKYREMLSKTLNESNFLFQKVTGNYQLAKLDFEQKEYHNARARCAYIVENGNKMYQVEEAKRMLEEIEEAKRE